MPFDQADGLRRMFAHARARFVPVVSNPHLTFGGVMLERLCAAFGELGRHTLVVDAGENAPMPSEMSVMDMSECIEPLAPTVSYLAARGLPLRFVDTHGSTESFLHAASDAAPQADVVLIHAPAADLCRLFARADESLRTRPLLLADDRPSSVTHAYASMKLLTQRAQLVVHDLLLSAAPTSPRADRIAMQIAACADDYLGAVLRDWVRIDPSEPSHERVCAPLLRWAREALHTNGSAFDALNEHMHDRGTHHAAHALN